MKIGSVFGVDVRLNRFFLLLFFLYFLLGLMPQGLIAFGVVIIHELAHVITATGYGIKVREVELLPFGGVARIEAGLEENPATETVVALAGPLTNGIMLVAALGAKKLGWGNPEWLPFFIRANVLVGCFNLLPALPLDGGRIYRAWLAGRIGLKEATERAADLGRLFAIGFAGVGLFALVHGKTDYNLFVAAVFLYYAASREKGSAMYLFLRYLARKKAVLARRGAMLSRQVVAVETTPLKDLVRYFVPGKYHLVTVLDHNRRVLRVLTETEVIDGMLTYGWYLSVGDLSDKKRE
jgi:stage IV sporulation protein FB